MIGERRQHPTLGCLCFMAKAKGWVMLRPFRGDPYVMPEKEWSSLPFWRASYRKPTKGAV
jgi:hypothetical protein